MHHRKSFISFSFLLEFKKNELQKAESEWQYYIGKKYRQFEKHGAKIQIIDALEPFLSSTYKSQIGFSELLLSITGTPKVISMTVKDLVDKLTQERYKKIPKGMIFQFSNNNPIY